MAKRTSKIPGVWPQVGEAFKMIFKNLNLFFPLFLVGVVFCALTIDISHVTSIVFGLATFLLAWLTTIFILRHLLAGEQITFRDALYNSTTSIVPTVIILLVAAVQCLPLVLVAILLDTAIETNLFAMFGPALLFWLFSFAMLLITLYLLAPTSVALTAVSVPGLYPFAALSKASKIVRGRRGSIVLRLLVLCVILAASITLIMMPVYLWNDILPAVAALLAGAATTFATIYAATYLYIYYKWLIGGDDHGKDRG